MMANAAAIRRELGALQAELAAYPDDESCFRDVPGLPNSGGTLALHCAGNIRHFVGHVLGGSSYVRDRAHEFAARDVPRATLSALLEAAAVEAGDALARLDPRRLDDPWPGALPDGLAYTIRTFLQHLTSHLAYHVGQADYHRRIVTGDARSVGALAIGGLRAATPPMDAAPPPVAAPPAPAGVAYEVLATVREDRMAAYLAWLAPDHVREVVETGCFTHATVVQLDATRVRVTYLAPTRAAVDAYLADYAPALRAKGLAAFPDGVTWSREIGRVVGDA